MHILSQNKELEKNHRAKKDCSKIPTLVEEKIRFYELTIIPKSMQS